MPKDKLKRFAEFREFKNAFDFPYEKKGKWRYDYFKNENPLVLELGCGKGEYTVELAQKFVSKNFIGIDLKSNRMWRGAKSANEKNLANVAFMRIVIEKITELFDTAEVDEIWITFPDPYPKDKHEKHRLTSPKFLELYRQILKPAGFVHLKTDDDGLFEFTLETLESSGIKPLEVIRDVHMSTEAHEELKSITTTYEKRFVGEGKKIKYCRFRLTLEN